MIEKHLIEGKHVETLSVMGKTCGSFVVYDNKIYRITGVLGAGPNFRIILEKDSTKERFHVSGLELKNVKVIVTPTGWINT